jgi:hypothetical protein
MYDDNQVDIPESFYALFRVEGRIKLTATREVILGRYELCEDLANHLVDYARARHFDLGISEDDVLERCHQGLLGGAAGVSDEEATWVIRRLAELQGWPCPALVVAPKPETD